MYSQLNARQGNVYQNNLALKRHIRHQIRYGRLKRRMPLSVWLEEASCGRANLCLKWWSGCQKANSTKWRQIELKRTHKLISSMPLVPNGCNHRFRAASAARPGHSEYSEYYSLSSLTWHGKLRVEVAYLQVEREQTVYSVCVNA